MKRTHLLLPFILLFLTACSSEIVVPATPATTPTATQVFIITATLPPTQTPLPTQTLVPPTATQPFVPIEGQTTSLLNVRQAPSAASAQIGEVAIFEKVQITGKDPTGKWWLIQFPESPTGQGWVVVEFVQVSVDVSGVPVIDPTPQAAQNVPTAEASGTEGVAAPTVPPTQVYATAPEDGDSAEAPAVHVTLSKNITPLLTHQSDLSAPEGDGNDWVQFSLDGKTGEEKQVSLIVNCSGSGKFDLELGQNSVPLQRWTDMTCDRPQQLQLYLYVSAPYTLRLSPTQNNNSVSYIAYTLTIQLTR